MSDSDSDGDGGWGAGVKEVGLGPQSSLPAPAQNPAGSGSFYSGPTAAGVKFISSDERKQHPSNIQRPQAGSVAQIGQAQVPVAPTASRWGGSAPALGQKRPIGEANVQPQFAGNLSNSLPQMGAPSLGQRVAPPPPSGGGLLGQAPGALAPGLAGSHDMPDSKRARIDQSGGLPPAGMQPGAVEDPRQASAPPTLPIAPDPRAAAASDPRAAAASDPRAAAASDPRAAAASDPRAAAASDPRAAAASDPRAAAAPDPRAAAASDPRAAAASDPRAAAASDPRAAAASDLRAAFSSDQVAAAASSDAYNPAAAVSSGTSSSSSSSAIASSSSSGVADHASGNDAGAAGDVSAADVLGSGKLIMPGLCELQVQLARASSSDDYVGVQLPTEYRIHARAHLDKIQAWFPMREGRHFLVVQPDPRDAASAGAFAKLRQDLLDRDRAGVVEAPGRRVIHVVPPTAAMLKQQVVPPQHKDKLLAVYGKKR